MPQRNITRVTRMAENIEAQRPMVRVMAKPLMVPLPSAKRMTAVMSEVMLESKIALKAFSYAASTAFLRDLPAASSSRSRS